MALSKIDVANMVENQMPQANVADNINFRNIIINGDMSVSQRSTSTSGVSTTGQFVLDRWKLNVDSMGAWTISQSTDVPTGQGFANSMKWDCTTADASPAADDNIQLQQRFEGQNLQYLKKGTSSAESTTLSFWVKSNKTGTYICELRDKDNSNRHINKSYTISSADTWEKKTITFAGDTTGTLTNDNSTSIDLNFWLGAGSTYTSGSLQTSWGASTSANRAVGQVNLADSTSNEWYITGVQLEAGTTASDFEFLPHDVNKHRCLRYFQDLAPKENDDRFTLGENVSTTRCDPILYFKPELRAAPSFSSSAANTFSLYHAGTSRDCTSVSMDSINNTGGNMLFNVSSGLTAGGCSQVLTNGTGTECFFDAEL
mgnify:CR=1 FL=1|jgi:hypothetical protein